MRFQWSPTVLLEWDSNLTPVAQLVKKTNCLICNFANFHFLVTFFAGGSEKL